MEPAGRARTPGTLGAQAGGLQLDEQGGVALRYAGELGLQPELPEGMPAATSDLPTTPEPLAFSTMMLRI